MMGLSAEAQEAVLLSLRVAGVATLASLPFALAAATLLARGRFAGRWVLNGLVHLPLVLPPVVTGYLLLLAFGRQGPIGGLLEAWFGITFAFRWTGAALAGAVMGFPLMVRAIRLSLETVDPKLDEAAATLGAGPVWRFALVTLPLILPGIVAGMVLGFAKALGEFGATITFVSNIPGETRTLPTAIYTFLQVPGAETEAVVLSVLSIAIALGALALAETLGRAAARLTGERGDEAQPRARRTRDHTPPGHAP
ncbi:MAG: molybdate ABC transporter permease subunit [Pseudomonadota bacterium]